jgi:hypothetical protein
MEFNPFAPGVNRIPYPCFAHPPDHSPMYSIESLQAWSATRQANVACAARNARIFSSAPIIAAILDRMNPHPK